MDLPTPWLSGGLDLPTSRSNGKDLPTPWSSVKVDLRTPMPKTETKTSYLTKYYPLPQFSDAPAITFMRYRVSGHEKWMCRHPQCKQYASTCCSASKCQMSWCFDHASHDHARCPYAGCTDDAVTESAAHKGTVCCTVHYYKVYREQQAHVMTPATASTTVCGTCKKPIKVGGTGFCDGCGGMWMSLKSQKVRGPFG